VVVGADDVAEGGEPLFDASDLDGFGEGIAKVLQFLIGSCGGDEEAFAVAVGRPLPSAPSLAGRRAHA